MNGLGAFPGSAGPVQVLRPEVFASADIRGVAFDFDDTLVRVPLEWQGVMAGFFAQAIHCETADEQALAATRTRELARIRSDSGMSLTEFMHRLQREVHAHGAEPVLSIREYRAGFDKLWRASSSALHTQDVVTPGAVSLIRTLQDLGVEVYVVTGGDRQHKVAMMTQIGLGRLIPSSHIYGDDDPRMSGVLGKSAALRHIENDLRSRVLAPCRHRCPVVALIGDGRRDMEAARAAGAAAIGFNQWHEADAVVVGSVLPPDPLTQLVAGGRHEAGGCGPV
jgi:phosphoglycolate phosphatase-like HAD superfamily hydrolase